MTKDAEKVKAAERAEESRRYLAFLAKRIPELHDQGKPEPEYDEQGRIIPGRVGTFPGRRAREQADREWAVRNR